MSISSSFVQILIVLLVGISAALFAAWMSKKAADVPDEDRTYRDRPPVGMRLLWAPIQWVSYYLGPHLSVGFRERVLGQLRLAGLDYALSPEQFVATRVLGGLVGLLLVVYLSWLFGVSVSWSVGLMAMVFGYFYPAIWLRDQLKLRKQRTLKTLPFMLDMLTLCVEAGLNLTGGIQQAVAKGPEGPLRDELARVLRDVRAGKPRATALRQLADRMNEPSIHSLVSALIQAESTGMDLGPVLRAQAEQRRAERFARAEKLAMEAPVKMLFPLIAFIFPCTFLVLGFPIAMKFMALGL
jgi:tight adherence protein C